ncbi:hypothetical protein C8046_13385 [Serinibacter arcticus]|uniref:Uncharacterized protein n=2 Tax=Serinibacter arcticus TaxID=1655435 RepID=A0A2U1ZX58_9MICO|nr:hypothetical protein C8046_13385 [Serinibacter arcticus]
MATNGPEVPFVWSTTPTGLVGTWNYADAQWAGPLAAGAVDATYRLIVELDDDATYTLTDHTQEAQGGVGFGGGSASFSSFRGTVRRKSFNSSAAPIASDHGQVGQTFGWNFDSAVPKRVLQDVLAQHGWSERKVGFWARLTGRTS